MMMVFPVFKQYGSTAEKHNPIVNGTALILQQYSLKGSCYSQTWTEAASFESMLSVGEKRCLDGENMILVLGGNAGGTSFIRASIS